MPVATDAMASVAISDGIRNRVTSTPLTSAGRQCRPPSAAATASDGGDLVEDQSADDHRAQAAHGGEREVELGRGEGDREADAEDREEAHLLPHVEQIGRD